MSREFGIYPTDREPTLWIGCRAIITNRNLDIPWDRWSNDIKYAGGKEDFVWWINNVAIPKIEQKVRSGEKKFEFFSESNLFYCEADDRNSGGYLYIGFGSTEKYDEMIKEVK